MCGQWPLWLTVQLSWDHYQLIRVNAWEWIPLPPVNSVEVNFLLSLNPSSTHISLLCTWIGRSVGRYSPKVLQASHLFLWTKIKFSFVKGFIHSFYVLPLMSFNLECCWGPVTLVLFVAFPPEKVMEDSQLVVNTQKKEGRWWRYLCTALGLGGWRCYIKCPGKEELMFPMVCMWLLNCSLKAAAWLQNRGQRHCFAQVLT